MHIGIVGSGAIGLASAAWLASGGHMVSIWSPRGSGGDALPGAPLSASGLVNVEVPVCVVSRPDELIARAEVLFVAVPLHAHRVVMDALLPHLSDGRMVIVSAMCSLSGLYLYERARARGIFITVACLSGTTLTARRTGPGEVRITQRCQDVGLSTLPAARGDAARVVCEALFGMVFRTDANVLASSLSNVQPALNGPLALLNWTRIERGERWSRFEFTTPRVASVIRQLDAERIAVAQAFGLRLRTVEEHLSQCHGTRATTLIDIASEVHAERGGPLGPVDVRTRYLSEGMPYGLVFWAMLGRMAGVPMSATQATVDMAALVTGVDYHKCNDLLGPLGLSWESRHGLLKRVNVTG